MKNRPNTIGRLRHWLPVIQAPNHRWRFIASDRPGLSHILRAIVNYERS